VELASLSLALKHLSSQTRPRVNSIESIPCSQARDGTESDLGGLVGDPSTRKMTGLSPHLGEQSETPELRSPY
jgi:hypothetical protein